MKEESRSSANCRNWQFWFTRVQKRTSEMRLLLPLILPFPQRKPSMKEWFKTASVWIISPFSVSIHPRWWYFLYGVAHGIQISHLFGYSKEMYCLSFLKALNPDDTACSSDLEISCFSDWAAQWMRCSVGQNHGDSGVLFWNLAYLRWLFWERSFKSIISSGLDYLSAWAFAETLVSSPSLEFKSIGGHELSTLLICFLWSIHGMFKWIRVLRGFFTVDGRSTLATAFLNLYILISLRV